jgi:hypothetical protein
LSPADNATPPHARQKVALGHFRDEVRQDWDDVVSTG